MGASATRRPARYAVMALLALVIGCTIALLVAELIIRSRGLDLQSLGRTLQWQVADIAVHRVSPDTFLHCDLDPGSRYGCDPWNRCSIAVNSMGARAPELPAAKGDGVFRVLCFGGSSMFGVGARNEQTTCARLGQRLQRQAPEGVTVEAWNFGANAYNLAQMAHLARTKMAELDPDLVLVLLSNTGRRCFLLTDRARGGDYSEVLPMDGWLHPENVPPPDGVPLWLHRLALRGLASYRLIMGGHALRVQTADIAAGRESPWATALSHGEARALTAEASQAGVHLLYVPIPCADHQIPDHVYPGLPPELFHHIRDPDMPREYRDVHPPSAILDAWAEHIVPGLEERGMVPWQPSP
jgi:hypothetical protein